MKKIFIAMLALLMIGCTEDVPENATINYKMVVMPSQNFDFAQFTFEYTRAHRIVEDNKGIRTVYLDPKEVETSLAQNQTFALGSSEIEPEPINGFDFGFSPFTVVQNQDTILLNQPSRFDDFTAASLSPSPGQTINVTFQLDLDASVVLDSAGENWIILEITVIKE